MGWWGRRKRRRRRRRSRRRGGTRPSVAAGSVTAARRGQGTVDGCRGWGIAGRNKELADQVSKLCRAHTGGSRICFTPRHTNFHLPFFHGPAFSPLPRPPSSQRPSSRPSPSARSSLSPPPCPRRGQVQGIIFSHPPLSPPPCPRRGQVQGHHLPQGRHEPLRLWPEGRARQPQGGQRHRRHRQGHHGCGAGGGGGRSVTSSARAPWPWCGGRGVISVAPLESV